MLAKHRAHSFKSRTFHHFHSFKKYLTQANLENLR